ncbi:hypothetical protein OROGR_000315 [Orobanche gracilis]
MGGRIRGGDGQNDGDWSFLGARFTNINQQAQLISKKGKVLGAKICSVTGTLKSSGYGFVSFVSEEDAEAAISSLNNATHYTNHEDMVKDVSWHSKNENLFGPVGDDCKLLIWDLHTDKFQHSVVIHEKEVNYLSFNPFKEYVLATASSDTTVGLFDIRNSSSPLHSLESITA